MTIRLKSMKNTEKISGFQISGFQDFRISNFKISNLVRIKSSNTILNAVGMIFW
jgi:hypothetical protein